MADQSTESSTMREGSVGSMKDTLRELISTQRKERREALLNKNRVALGEIAEDSKFTPEFVAATAKELTKKTLSIDKYHQLQNALIQNEENAGAFLHVANAISSLVRDMSCNKPATQLSAANCCCNLALGNDKTCATLAKGISAYLLIVLEGCNRPIMEVALWTIGNMVTGCRTAFNILHAQHALKHLTSLLKDCDNDILPAVSYATVHYLYTGSKWIEEQEKQEVIKVIAHRKFLHEHTEFLWLVALLSSVDGGAPYFYTVLPAVIDLLQEAVNNNLHSITKITAYIRIIGNSTAEPSGIMARMFLENPKLPTEELHVLLDKLLYHQHMHIRREALWLIGNLYNHGEPSVHQKTRDILRHLTHTDLAISSLV